MKRSRVTRFELPIFHIMQSFLLKQELFIPSLQKKNPPTITLSYEQCFLPLFCQCTTALFEVLSTESWEEGRLAGSTSSHEGGVKHFLYKSSYFCQHDSLPQAFLSFYDYQSLVQCHSQSRVLEGHPESVHIIGDIPKSPMKTV